MSKKFTMLLMSLLCVVGVAKAGVTDFPTMSDGENIKWYTISNTRSASGKYLYWTESGVKDSNTRTGASFFYVTGSADTCYIHNYATDLLFSGNGAWTAEGVACKLSVSPNEKGLMIGFNGTYLNEQNYDNGFTTWGDINDAGSIFVFEEVTDFSAIIDVPAAKTAAIAEINNYAVVSTLYPATADAVDAVNAVNPASTGLKDLNDAVEAINAIVVDYRDKAYQALEGKYFTIQTLTTERSKGFMQMSTSNVVGSATAESPANIWQFVCSGNGTVNVYNPYTGKYLCEPQGNSSNITVTTDKASAGAYVLNVNNTNPAVADAKVKFTSNGKSVHMAGGHTLVRWDNGGASEWQVVEVTDFSDIIDLYKAASTATLDSWATLSVVFDAALIDAAEAAINGIATTDWATFAAIDAELTKVTDAVAAKMFTFQTIATDSHRENVWVSANMSTEKAIGLHGEHNYNSIWSLRHAGGVSFYLYNELNSVYMGKPSENCPLTENPAAAYTFEVIDANNNTVEMKTNGETLHASNHDDDKLLNWDGDEDASRWMVKIIDVAKDIQDLLDTIEESDYAEVPALGQYPTAAYEALVEARTSARTVEDVEAAIAAFEASLNRPVYFITSAWDSGYPAGSAIYYDDDGMNWLWKKANKFDRQMWMTIPGYTNDDVPSVDAYDKDGTHYGFYDYFTGTKMRNLDVQIVAVPSWADAYNLQYDGQAMHAQSDKKLVGWYPATISSNQASAWKIEYLGNSYSLGKLSEGKLKALANLQAAFDSKSYLFNAVYGDGLGQYQGDGASIYSTLMEVAQFLSSKLNLFADEGCTVENINALTNALNAIEVSINMPEDGKYYRIYGANNVIPSGYYITCHTNNDGGRIALTAEADASTIYYYKDGKLQAYLNGKYIATSSNHYVFDNKDHAASDITFEASNHVAGAFTIKSAGVFLHYKVYFDAVELDRCGVDEAVGHDWYLQEVTMEEINKDIVTDLSQVSDQARYKIYGERGFMYVDAANGIVKSTYSVSNRVDYSPVNEYHNFAIVNIDGKSYLYSVGAKKFVVKSGNTVALVDFPEQEITIEAAADQNTDYDWLIKMGGTNLLNITNQHNSGIYTAYNTEDPGNRWALRKVGKFDPEYATTVRKVSVSYTVDGKTTTKAHAIKEGNTFSFTIPNASFSVVTSCKLGTEEMKDAEGGKFSFVVERDTALSVEIETNLPIKVAENANNIPADAWYYFVMHSNQRKYIQYLPDSTYIEWRDAAVRRDSIDTYSWALVGNVLDGFKLVNKAAKDMALLSKGSGNPSMGAYANGTAFLLDSTSTEIEGAFCLKYPNGNYLNASSGKVAHWNAADAGSTIIPALSASESLAELAALLPYAETVATIDNDKAESLTTAISAAQEVYNTSTDNAAVEAQVTALNTAIDNVIKAEVGSGLFRLKNSASDLYMTIVTPEAADGIQIKAKDSDATKQAFYIESTAEVGVYNIKSTENYFMASSGYWNYGAYQTANEAGRAHKVEYLGEGKYALKTLLGYAGPNKNTTDENSPLYSNHTADNNGREWELEALNELEVLVVDAQLLKMTVDANTGDKIGEYAAATSETLAAAIETAKTKGDAATADDVAALQAVMDNTKVILPTADKYYQIYSALGFAETKAVYSDGNAPMWETLNANDKTFFWQAVATADGIALKNVADGKFLNGNAGQSGAWSVSDTPANIDVTILTKEGANGYQYGVVLNDWQMHAAGHNGGKGTSGSIVSWNAEAGSASAWYMVEVELPEFYTVVYNFKYEGATKYTQTATLSAGAEFPEFTVKLPYGVSVADERPTGTVTGNHTIDFNLKIEKALPFVAATDVNSIKTWYYVQMHANAAVTAYLEDNGGENIAWNNKSVDDSEIDSHLWGFVGDVWNGIKMVNKNTGNAIVSTRGNAVLGTAANATAFIPTISNGVLSDWFCLKYPESNYLNAQGNQAEGAGIVASYGNADNGSSLFVTEYNKEYVVSVSSVGYSTYYSDYRLVIPATVEAYVVTSVENREVVLEQVTGVLPAHTGVILRGKGDHSFVTSAAATAEIETNLLKGTTTKQLITPAEGYTCYVLANPAGGNGVGLYIASLNKDENGNEGNTHFYNNANKVYLPVENPVVEEESGQSARALRFRFGGEGTTEIEPSTLNSQPSTIIYDLTGRRINEIVEKGIYIVNGKKVVIR